jgi:NTE family protein
MKTNNGFNIGMNERSLSIAKKLIAIMLIASISYNGIAQNVSETALSSSNTTDSETVIILDEQESEASQGEIMLATESATPPKQPATANHPITTPEPKIEEKEEKGIISTIMGWFSSSPEEEKKASEKASKKPLANKKSPRPVVIGLALGGGAAKGFAHIGVIKALEENGIRPKIVTGTSAGSLVGSLYSYGYTSKQLEKIASQLDGLNLADFTLSGNGLIKGQKLQNFVNQQVKQQQMQKLKIRFAAIATDLDSGQSVGFNHGNTGAAVRASCAVPNIFIPVRINNRRYVDGGLSAPVPVSHAKKMGANFIIAVDITSKPEHTKASGFLSNFDQTINIMGVKLLNEQLKLANFTVKPDISKLSSFNFDNKQQAINLGYKATLPLIPKIKQQILQMQNQ